MQTLEQPLADTPEPGRGEVRVRLCWLRLPVWPQAPAAPLAFGDGAGVIDAIGEGVSTLSLGLAVWVWKGRGGCAFSAPYMTVPAAQAVPLPDGVPLEAGACLGTPALTAMHAVLVAGGVAGRRVLVTGGAGAEGHYALQFARLAGAAQVIAVAGNALEAGVALDAGAHATLIDGEAGLSGRIRALCGGAGVDRVIEADAGANLARDLELVRDDGDIVVIAGGEAGDISLPLAGALRRNLRLRFVDAHALGELERRRAVFELQAWLERGLVRHRIAARLPLARLDEAQAMVRSGRAAGHVLLALA